MAKDNTIQNELIEISQAVANLQGENPFAIPTDYFKTFPQKIMEKIENEGISTTEPIFSPTLATLRDKNPYTIPSGYFSKFDFPTPKEDAKVIRMSFNRIAKYAAAACLVGLTLGLFYFFNMNVQPTTLASNQVSATEIEQYLNETDILEMGEKEIDFPISEGYTLLDISASTISEMLKDVPDGDISRFLDQNSLTESNSMN
jgi:hypothetical protein